MKKAPASVGMLRPDEMNETVEILQVWDLTLRVKKCGELAEGQSRPKGSLEGMRSTIPLANREAEGRKNGGPFFEFRFHVSLLTLIAFFIGDAVVTFDDVGREDGVFLLSNRKRHQRGESLVPKLLFYDAFAFVIMLCFAAQVRYFLYSATSSATMVESSSSLSEA